MTSAEITPLNDNPDIRAAQRVLHSEASALSKLAETLNEDFIAAVDLLQSAKGRVIISGMGKSGHIGTKIAATMASTGTPAQFVHPGEASHGDLGMITSNDAVLMISNSGETKELSDLLAYVQRFDIPSLAITRQKNSTLGKSVNLTLTLPDIPEACPMGLAPTTSTTATLALGDALAVALLERNAFKADDFATFHPGGKLGSSLLKVEDIMHQGEQLPLVSPEWPMGEVLIEITQKSFGCVGVIDGQKQLLGVITDGDLRRHMNNGLLNKSAQEIMSNRPKTIQPDVLAARALRRMSNQSITALFVVDDDNIVRGILHLHDLLRQGVA